MNMWIIILAGFLIVTLGSALEDAGVYVNATFSQGKFERRVLPPSVFICTTKTEAFEWWRINLWEQVLQNFESGNKIGNATLRLGTPALHILSIDTVEFHSFEYCRYLPKVYQKDTLTLTGVRKANWKVPIEYFAVKAKNTERATVKQRWNYLKNLVKNRFPGITADNLVFLLIEIAASGQVYVGAF